MNSMQNIIDVCNRYIDHKFNIEDFQSRLTTAIVPDNLTKQTLILLHNTLNWLEQIQFCQLERDHYKYAIEIANQLIEECKLYEK